MVEDIGGPVQRYECPECGTVRLLARTRSDVECKECGAEMEHQYGKVVQNPASAMHEVAGDVREVKGDEDLYYR